VASLDELAGEESEEQEQQREDDAEVLHRYSTFTAVP
jgi:hypothetical protein